MSAWPPRSYVDRIFNIKQWTDMQRGGHFAATRAVRTNQIIKNFFLGL